MNTMNDQPTPTPETQQRQIVLQWLRESDDATTVVRRRETVLWLTELERERDDYHRKACEIADERDKEKAAHEFTATAYKLMREERDKLRERNNLLQGSLDKRLWCAYCGKTGDHQSGWCKQIEVDQLREQVLAWKERNARELAAIDVCAMSDTVESAKTNRIERGHELWTPAYDSVVRRVDECIALREQLRLANELLNAAKCPDCSGDGIIVHAKPNRFGEPQEPEQAQCQWCADCERMKGEKQDGR